MKMSQNNCTMFTVGIVCGNLKRQQIKWNEIVKIVAIASIDGNNSIEDRLLTRGRVPMST